jgi:hypothetical protein
MQIQKVEATRLRCQDWLAAFAAILIAAACVSPYSAHAQGPFEKPPVFKASRILPPSLFRGPHYQVQEDVVNDGYINHYSINSKFGTFTGITSAKLRQRIREINALAAMEKIRGTKVFRESVVEAGSDVVQGIKMFVTSPVETVGGAVSGVSKTFSRLGEHLFGSKRSDTEDARWKSIIGFSKTKREYAYDFNVDVYSTNKALQEELNDIAWAGYTGGITVAGFMTAIPGGAGIATSVTGGSRLMNEVYATTAPVDLRKMNREKLIKMGVNEDIANLFIDNAVFSPRQQTDLVFALEDLKGVDNRDVFVKFAISTNHPDVAFFRQRMAQMYASYHKNITPVGRFVALGRDVPVKGLGLAQTVDGVLILHVPLDYLVWTEPMARIFYAIDKAANGIPGAKGKELWLAGGVSALARKNINAAGWNIHDGIEINLLGKIEGANERISYR